jgi:hypothetical protein
MTEEQAEVIADAFGGQSWQSGGGIYVVKIWRSDGRLVVIGDECVCNYEDEEGFEMADSLQTISLE